MQSRDLASMIHEQVEKYSDRKNALYYKEGNEWKVSRGRNSVIELTMLPKDSSELGVEEKNFSPFTRAIGRNGLSAIMQ